MSKVLVNLHKLRFVCHYNAGASQNLVCDHASESCRLVMSHGTVFDATFGEVDKLLKIKRV